MTKKYQWREDAPKPPIDADVFGSTIEKIAAGAPLNLVKPDAIVEAARPKNSPIHAAFDWDNKAAAESWRKQQARMFVSALQIVRVHVTEGPALSSRAFFSVSQDGERGYAGQSRIMSDKDLRAQVIDGARKDLDNLLVKYQGVAALGSYVARLQEIVEEIRDELDRINAEAKARRQKTRPSGADAEALQATK